MPRVKVPAYFGFVLICMFLSASITSRQSLQAQDVQTQNPSMAGTMLVVRMMDAVDSGSDPAGKEYRAKVNKAVNAGNAGVIALGAAATVTLAKSGSGYAAQLSSVVINGQAVAVTSGAASVTGAAQNAAGNAASALNSVLGGFGHRTNAPASVAAVATGQRVVLPLGTTLSFVLGEPPLSNAAASAAPAATAAPISQPLTASAGPAPNSASGPAATSGASAGGPLTAMEICFSNAPPTPSDPNHKTEYLTAAFEVPVETLRAVPVLEPAFSAYLKATYQYPSAGITCQPIWSIAEAQTVEKKIANDRDSAKLKIIDTGWRYGQPPLAQGQSGFDPLAQGPGGLDLSQHRLTTYYCTLVAAGGTSWVAKPGPPDATRYVSPIFQADWDSAAVSNAWYAYIRDHYVHDLDQPLNGATFGSGTHLCSAQSPAMQAMMHPGALQVDKVGRHIVAVDWTYTPAQVAAAKVAAAPAAPVTASTASSTGGPFISCSTSGGAGIDTYYTGVFQTTHPVKRLPNGGVLVDQSVLDRFYAYLTQKGYKFSHGSNYGCDVKPTEAEAKAAQHKRAYEGGGCSTCGKVVETGWKDE